MLVWLYSLGVVIMDQKYNDTTLNQQQAKSRPNNQQAKPNSISDQNKDDQLINILKANNLYDDLYDILSKNNIDLDIITNDMKSSELNEFCKSYNLDYKYKLKLRKLLRIISADAKMTISLVGDSGVGKTSLMRKYVDNKFSDALHSSFGGDVKEKLQILPDGSTMKIKIWDTAGQERFNSVCESYYKKADVIIICYGINDELSLKNCEGWRQQIEENARDDVIVFLIGCKSDALRRDVMAKTMIRQPNWKQFNTYWCECSAQTGDNVRNIFIHAATMVLQQRKKKQKLPAQYQDQQKIILLEVKPKNDQGGCLC